MLIADCGVPGGGQHAEPAGQPAGPQPRGGGHLNQRGCLVYLLAGQPVGPQPGDGQHIYQQGRLLSSLPSQLWSTCRPATH